MKLSEQEFMGVVEEMQMVSGITMESTPKKADCSGKKRKLEPDANETQGPLMNNPMNPVYKPGPAGDSAPSSSEHNTSTESSPKRRKMTHKRPVRRKLELKDPRNVVPKLTIDRHKMKVVWKSIPETANLDEIERKIDIENVLIDTGDIMPEEIPERDTEKINNHV